MTKNAVAVKNENTAIATYDESAFAGVEIGNEDIVASQYRMPLYKIVEPLSKALIEGESFYVEGAKVGDIIDTAVGEVIGTEMEFLPVKAVTLYIEKDADDKTVAKHESRSILEKTVWRTESGKKKGTFLPNGNEIQETVYIYGINISSGYDWGAIPFSRGRLAASQTILGQLRKQKMENGANAPFIYRVWDMKVQTTKSSDGKPFRTWKAVPGLKTLERPDAEILLAEAVGVFNPSTGEREGGLLNALKNKQTIIEDTEHDSVSSDESVPF